MILPLHSLPSGDTVCHKKNIFRTFSRKLVYLTNQLKTSIPFHPDFHHVSQTAKNFNQAKLDNKIVQHQRKLWNLGIHLNKKIDPSKVIFNYSDRVLTKTEQEALSLGLDFALPCDKLSFAKHFYSFDSFNINPHIDSPLASVPIRLALVKYPALVKI